MFWVGRLRQSLASQPDWLAVRRNVRDRLRPQKTASFSIAFLSFLSFPSLSLPALSLSCLTLLIIATSSPSSVNVFTLLLTSALLSPFPLVKFSLTSSFCQAPVLLFRLGKSVPVYRFPCRTHLYAPLFNQRLPIHSYPSIMSSSEDDTPLVKANGRSTGEFSYISPVQRQPICGFRITTILTPLNTI